MILAPKWTLSAQAIDAAGSPFLQKGNHLRVVPSAEFGLPRAPFIIYRADVTSLAPKLASQNVVWTTRGGQVLTLPFNIPPGESVTGWLPSAAEGVCCYIEVQAEKISPAPPRMDALVHNASMPLHPAVIASTSRLPLALAVSRIDRVSVSGGLRITGVRWVDARTLIGRSKPKFWKLLPLPAKSGARYTGVADPASEAKDRVDRGAPPRMGRHEERTAFFASTGGLVTSSDEIDRVNLYQTDIDGWLDALINDTSLPEQDLTTPYTVAAEGAEPMARQGLEVQTLGLLLQSGMDPGVGRYLGFMDTDQEFLNLNPGTLMAYFVRGLFGFDKANQSKFLRALEAKQLIGFGEARKIFIDAGLELKDQVGFDALLDCTAVAIAIIGNPPDVPGAAQMRPADISGPFMPSTPPAARREVVLRGDNLPPFAALERRNTAGVVSLNRLTIDGKRALPLIPGVPETLDGGLAGAEPGGEFVDREAPPESQVYRIALGDWFGRWGDWFELPAGPKTRPLPPAPNPSIHYDPPEVTPATPLDPPLGGTLRIELAVPPLENLAAGSFPLDKAHLIFSEAGTALFSQVEDPADPHALPDHKLVVTLTDHPDLRVGRALRRTITLVTRWEDSAGRLSNPSPPLAFELIDPRPPVAVVIPGTLDYSARPDVSGIARVDLRWTTAPTQRRFRVYYTDAVGARAYWARLAPDNPGAAAALADLDAAPGPVEQAGVFRSHKAALGPAAFTQLTRDPLEFSGAQGQFTHALSGSLQVLSLYRVVAVSDSNVDAPFGESALVPIGVPNSAPPAQPFLSLRTVAGPGAPRSDRIELVVEAARRPTRAVEYRLRRSTYDGTSPLAMPVVEGGLLPDPVGETVRTVIEQGLDAVQPLRPWIKYFWRVEVRGEHEPGAVDVPGQWSTASGPVSAVLIPGGPPDPPADLQIEVTPAGHTLSWTHPDASLNGGSSGAYTFLIYQQRLSDRPRLVGRLAALALPAAGGRPTPDGRFSLTIPTDAGSGGASYRVVLEDPLKRVSRPVTGAAPADGV